MEKQVCDSVPGDASVSSSNLLLPPSVHAQSLQPRARSVEKNIERRISLVN